MHECRHTVCQKQGKRRFSSVNYIILTLGKVALKLSHKDEMLNKLLFWCKDKFLPVHTMKAYGNGGTALLTLILAINGSEKSATCPCHCIFVKNRLAPTEQKAFWVHCWWEYFGEQNNVLPLTESNYSNSVGTAEEVWNILSDISLANNLRERIYELYKRIILCITNLSNAIVHLDLLAQVSSTALTDPLNKNPR